MKRRIALVLATLALTLTGGCAKAPRTDYTFSFEGSDEHYAAALEAAAEWNVCNTVHVVLTRDHGGIPIREVAGPITGPSDCPCDGYTQPGASAVEYTTDEDVRATITHELGHAFGLSHADGARIMSPPFVWANGAAAHVTSEDCAALESRP